MDVEAHLTSSELKLLTALGGILTIALSKVVMSKLLLIFDSFTVQYLTSEPGCMQVLISCP